HPDRRRPRTRPAFGTSAVGTGRPAAGRGLRRALGAGPAGAAMRRSTAMKTLVLAVLVLLAGCALAAAALDGRPELAPRIGRSVDLALPVVAEDGSRTDLATLA